MAAISFLAVALGAVGLVVPAARWGLSLGSKNSQISKRESLPRLVIPENQPASPEIDICFVHGLTGDSTWGSKAEKVRWPTDFLAHQACIPDSNEPFPRPRILFYEYDTNVHSLAWLTARTLYYHANDLLDSLLKQRKKREERNRPLIFVAHSLGGLLVKNALVFSHRAFCDESESDGKDVYDIGEIYVSTCGIISFGVPQTFANNPRLTEMVKSLCSLKPRDPQDELSIPVFQDFGGNHWERDVDTLQGRLEGYYPLAREIPELYCCESPKNTNQIFTFARTVPPHAGNYVSQLSSYLPIPRNHSELAKFDTPDAVYKAICKKILVFYVNSQDSLQGRQERRKRKYSISRDASTSSSFMFQDLDFRIEPELPKKIRFLVAASQSRAELLKKVKERLSRNRYAVLTGPRGSGKTSLAVEYAHQHKLLYSSVFWLDSRSERTLELSFINIAYQIRKHYDNKASQSFGADRYAESFRDLVDLPVGKDQSFISESDRKAVISTVLNWLRCPGNTEWLLIYDDIEHSEASFLQDFLPAMKNIQSKRGYVLITSRNDHANRSEFKKDHIELSYSGTFLQSPISFGPKPNLEPQPTTNAQDYFIDPIEVEQFSAEESVTRSLDSLSHSTGREGEDLVRQNLDRAAYNLQHVPETIAHTGAFISASNMPLQVPTIHVEDLDQLAGIQDEYSSWYDACIMLGAGPIPIQLVERYFHVEKDVIGLSLEKLESTGAILIPDPQSGNFEIPKKPLRLRLQSLTADRGKAEKCAELACNAVVNYLEYLGLEYGPEEQLKRESGEKTILEHVDRCLEHYRDYRDIPCEWDILARLCEIYGRYYHAAVFYRAANGQRFRNNMTEARVSQGIKSDLSEGALIDAWFKADDLSKNRALVSDLESPALLSTILSIDTRNSRKLRNELSLIRIQFRMKNYADPNTQIKLKVSDNASKDSRNKSKSGGREFMNPVKRCLSILNEIEDRYEDHYVSLKAEVLQQMVLMSVRRDDWLAALQWNRSLIETLEKLVGPNGEETMKAVLQLAEIRMNQADFSGATPLLEQVLLTYEHVFGESHQKTIDVVKRLALVYSKQGNLKRSRDQYQRLVHATEKIFGKSHIETAKAQESLAKIFISLKDRENATKWYDRALKVAEMFGRDTVEFEKMSESHDKLFKTLDISSTRS